MTTTRVELAIEQTDADELGYEFCDDTGTAWLCAELSDSRAGSKGGFDARWLNR